MTSDTYTERVLKDNGRQKREEGINKTTNLFYALKNMFTGIKEIANTPKLSAWTDCI